MSIAQPENGLPERRMITADSFRALKLKLISGGRQAATPAVRPLELADPVPEAQPSANKTETTRNPLEPALDTATETPGSAEPSVETLAEPVANPA